MLEEVDQIEGIILELSAGIGGQEAMLFCNELLELYSNYCESEGWDYDLSDSEKTDIEGMRHASLIINHHGNILSKKSVKLDRCYNKVLSRSVQKVTI